MSTQNISINELLKNIEGNNELNFTLPYSKRELKTKRFNVDSISKLNEIFVESSPYKIVLKYYDYLHKLVKSRCDGEINYLDFLYIILYLRSAENNEFDDIDLNNVINNLDISNIKIKDEKVFNDKNIKFIVKYSIPNLNKLEEILKIAKRSKEDIVFYSVFKYVNSIQVHLNDTVSDCNTVNDLKRLYDAVSYKAIDEISNETNQIDDQIHRLFKVNIETDTKFLLTI